MKLYSKSVLVKLDRIDKNIIRALQNNGRMQNNDLARGLSPSSCLRPGETTGKLERNSKLHHSN